jgi:hypothetical protein
MATPFEMNILTHRDQKQHLERPGVRVIDHLTLEEAEKTPNLFVLYNAMDLPEVADVIRVANRAKHLRGLLVEQDHDLQWIITMLERANLRTLRTTLVHDKPEVFERVLNAWRLGAQDELIADATVQKSVLFVRSCALSTFEIPVADIKWLREASDDELRDIEVAEDGAHIYWPQLDIHLDLESLRVVLEPELRTRFSAERLKHNELMGLAVKSLRREASLRQTDVDGVSARQIRRIEEGAVPRSETLVLLARAHGWSLNEYLNRISTRIRELSGATEPSSR